MKRILSVLCVVGILLLSTVGALADPKAVPGTSNTITPDEQSITVPLNETSPD